MSNEQRLIFLMHGMIRMFLLERPVDEAYLAICKSIFPGAVLREFTTPRNKNHQDYLTKICDYIYELDDNEYSYASCYSASIAVQLVALAGGIDSEVVIGVKKQDIGGSRVGRNHRISFEADRHARPDEH
jgi:hypothetical protein